jgi:hypothetical protein
MMVKSDCCTESVLEVAMSLLLQEILEKSHYTMFHQPASAHWRCVQNGVIPIAECMKLITLTT